ncbi:MAG TPA: TadE family protein [Chloroflexota bacterium]|nr:TadE family protein [Chloroflexota bacterium]
MWARQVRSAIQKLVDAGYGQRGQALVELALVIPILLLLAFGVVAAGRVTQAQMGVSAVAREAARAAALANDSGQAAADGMARGQEVATGYSLGNGSLQLAVNAGGFSRGGTVQASAHYTVSLADLPLLGWAHVTVGSAHLERVDLYRSFWQTRGTP